MPTVLEWLSPGAVLVVLLFGVFLRAFIEAIGQAAAIEVIKWFRRRRQQVNRR